ncbi:MAG: GLPGLI family protein [Flavobacteriaceae bacterium]
MKQTLTIICLLVALSIQGQENIEFTYEYQAKPRKSKPEYIQHEDITLITNGKKSLFISPVELIKDSIVNALKKSGDNYLSELQYQMSKQPKYKVKYSIYQENGNYLFSDKVFTSEIGYKETINHKWILENEFKEILGHSCQLAITKYQGRTYNCWFSRDIPINHGPYKFHGLPGMILEVYDTDMFFHFTVKSIKTKEVNFPELEFNNITFTNIEDYQDLKFNTFLIFMRKRSPKSMEKLLPKYEAKQKDQRYIEIFTE